MKRTRTGNIIAKVEIKNTIWLWQIQAPKHRILIEQDDNARSANENSRKQIREKIPVLQKREWSSCEQRYMLSLLTLMTIQNMLSYTVNREFFWKSMYSRKSWSLPYSKTIILEIRLKCFLRIHCFSWNFRSVKSVNRFWKCVVILL